MPRSRGAALIAFSPSSPSARQPSRNPVGRPRATCRRRRGSGNTVTFKNAQGVVAVTAIAPEIVRVRFAPGAALGRDHSYAIVSKDFGDPRATITTAAAGSTTIVTPALRVEIPPPSVPHRSVLGRRGLPRCRRTRRWGRRLPGPSRAPTSGCAPTSRSTGRREERQVEPARPEAGGYSFTMWNSDTFGYDASTDPIYASFPFYMVMRNGRAHGIFFDNTWRTNFDIGHQLHGVLSFGADGGDLDYYFIDGPDPKQVIARYTQLTGACRCRRCGRSAITSAATATSPSPRVRFIADNFRERRIPADYAVARHPLSRRLQPVHVGPDALSRSAADDRGSRAPGLPPRDDRRSASEESAGWPSTTAASPAVISSQSPTARCSRRRCGPRRPRMNPGPSVFPRFHQAGDAPVVGRTVQGSPRHGRRRHLERHERAGGLRRSVGTFLSTRATTTKDSRRITARSTTSTGC
jgi:hypothetical protein